MISQLLLDIGSGLAPTAATHNLPSLTYRLLLASVLQSSSRFPRPVQ